MANLTLYADQEMKTVNMDYFHDLTSYVDCNNSESIMSITLKTEKYFICQTSLVLYQRQ